MKRSLMPIAIVAGAALAVAVVAGTFAAYGGHNPAGNGARRGGPPILATAPAATSATGAAATPVAPPARVGSAAAPVAGTPLTPAQAGILQGMAEEEKLALDLYTALGRNYTNRIWANIASAEATHLAEVRALLAAYGVADPTVGQAAGSFVTSDMAALYSRLLAAGNGSFTEAHQAGRTVELDDISRLDRALSDGSLPADVVVVYSNLRRASYQHLASFERQLGR